MSAMNDDIWANPAQFPAVTEVLAGAIDNAAVNAATQLRQRDFALIELEPGDSTRYELTIVRAPKLPPSPFGDGPPFRFASSFGPLYPWMGNPSIHPDYAAEHYVFNHSMWTATVFALFLNSTAEAVAS